MKHLISATFLVLLMTACSTTKLISDYQLEKKNYQEVIGALDENQRKPDKSALYPNGINGIYEDIVATIDYPKAAKENNIQGKVVVEYIVETDGKVKEARIIESASRELDKEAIRVIFSLGRFYPGFNDGKPVRVYYKLPIEFKLD